MFGSEEVTKPSSHGLRIRKAAALGQSYRLKAEVMKVIQDFLGVRPRVANDHGAGGESYRTLFESSSGAPLGRILLFLRTKEGPMACEGLVSRGMKPHGAQMG